MIPLRKTTIDPLQQALLDSCQKETLLTSMPRSPRAYKRPQAPIDGPPPSQQETD